VHTFDRHGKGVNFFANLCRHLLWMAPKLPHTSFYLLNFKLNCLEVILEHKIKTFFGVNYILYVYVKFKSIFMKLVNY